MPDVQRAFKTPFVPLVPVLGIVTCLCMMLFLPADTWIRLVLWMLIGLVFMPVTALNTVSGIYATTSQRTAFAEHDRYHPLRPLRYHRVVAPADSGLG